MRNQLLRCFLWIALWVDCTPLTRAASGDGPPLGAASAKDWRAECMKLLADAEGQNSDYGVSKLKLALDAAPLAVTEEFITKLESENDNEFTMTGSEMVWGDRRIKNAFVESISHRLGVPPPRETQRDADGRWVVPDEKWVVDPARGPIRKFIAEARVKLKKKEAEEAAGLVSPAPSSVSEAELPRPVAPLAASEPSASEPAESGSLLFRIAAACAAAAAGVWAWMRRRGN